tara:strand:- start:3752 stop:4036 length:285 start_codon:yes stop_codon:yes gene_type:complete
MEDELNGNGDGTTTTQWIGNEVAFKIGERPIKIWEVLLGVVVLAIILPLLFRSGGGAGSSQGVTIVNTGAGSRPARRRTYKRRKRRQIKSITYK